MMNRLFIRLNARCVKAASDDLVSAYGVIMPESVRRDLFRITFAATIGMMFTVVTGFPGANPIFTAFLKQELRMSNMDISLVLAIPQLAVLIQIPLSLYLRRNRGVKRLFIISAMLVRVAFVLLAAIALAVGSQRLPLEEARRLTLLLIAVASILQWTSDLCVNTWLGALVPYPCRGRYLSTRQMFFTLSSVFYALLLIWLTSAVDGQPWQFAFLFALSAIFGFFDIGTFWGISDSTICMAEDPCVTGEQPNAVPREVEERQDAVPSADSNERAAGNFFLPLKDKRYRAYLLFVAVWYFAMNLSGPYFNVHMLNYLHLPLGMQTTYTTAATGLATVLTIRKMGQASDRWGYRNLLLLCTCGACVMPLLWMVITPWNSGLIIFNNFIAGVFVAAVDMNVFSMSIFLAPDRERPIYLVFKTLMVAVVAAAPGMLIGGMLMDGLALPLSRLRLPFVNGQTLLPFHCLLILSFFLRCLAVLVFARKLERGPNELGFKAFAVAAAAEWRRGVSGEYDRLSAKNWQLSLGKRGWIWLRYKIMRAVGRLRRLSRLRRDSRQNRNKRRKY